MVFYPLTPTWNDSVEGGQGAVGKELGVVKNLTVAFCVWHLQRKGSFRQGA